MIFVDTHRFSPVANKTDMPDKEDYFWRDPSDIDKDFLDSGDYYVDEEWWHRQEDRCRHGFEIKNAIAKGGDMLQDGKEALWTGNDCYIPLYDVLI